MPLPTIFNTYVTQSNILQVVVGEVVDYANRAGFAVSSTFAASSSYILTSASIASASYSDFAALSGFTSTSISTSYAATASYAVNVPITASYAVTASYALGNVKDIQIKIMDNQPANTVLIQFPSLLTEMDITDRLQFDLSTYTQYRVSSQFIQAGPSGSHIGIQYSLDQIHWNYLDATSGSLISSNSTGIVTSNWFILDVLSRSDVFIRWIAVNGDDISNTMIRYISLGVR